MTLQSKLYHLTLAMIGHTAAGWRPWIAAPEGLVWAPIRRVPWDVRLALKMGRWEREEIGVAAAVLDPTLPLIELGGGVGAVSIALNRLLDSPADHIVVEASRGNCELLAKTKARNGARFQIVNRAVGHSKGIPDSVSARFDASGRVVGSTALRDLADSAGFDRFNLVMDIEGAEYEVFRHEMELLRKRCVSLAFEFHDHDDPGMAGRLLHQVSTLGWTKYAAAYSTLGYRR